MPLSDLLVGTVPSRIQILALVGSLVMVGIVVHLIRQEKLKEGYSIIWFLVGLTMVLFASVTKLLDILASSIGISYSPAALFLILTGGLFILALHFSVLISKHDRQIRALAQENALLRNRLRTQQTAPVTNKYERERTYV